MKKFIISLLMMTTTLNANALKNPSLAAEQPIILEGKASSFDFMTVDNSLHRILAAHHKAGTLEMLDLTTGKALTSVEVGDAITIS